VALPVAVAAEGRFAEQAARRGAFRPRQEKVRAGDLGERQPTDVVGAGQRQAEHVGPPVVRLLVHGGPLVCRSGAQPLTCTRGGSIAGAVAGRGGRSPVGGPSIFLSTAGPGLDGQRVGPAAGRRGDLLRRRPAVAVTLRPRVVMSLILIGAAAVWLGSPKGEE